MAPDTYDEQGIFKHEIKIQLTGAFEKCCRQLEVQLGEKKFFGGEKPGIADFCVTSFM